jgi:ketosteroid isomerase-like protein
MGLDHQAKAEIVRKAFEGFQRLDMDAFTAAWHPQIVWDMRGYENWPGEQLEYEGEAEVIAGFAGYLGAVKKLEVSGLEVLPLEDGRVLGVHIERRAYETGEDTFLDIGTLYEFGGPEDEEQIVRVEVYTGHDRARRAAGLEATP